MQKELDSGNPHVAGFAIPGLTVTLNANVIRQQQTGHNVVALPAGHDARPPASSKPWVASARTTITWAAAAPATRSPSKQDANEIHHGADDNASGTAAVLAIGEALSKQPRKRNLMLAFWSGEELGLIGSNAFVTKPPVPIDQIAAYLNFDMVGRVSDNKLTVQATGTRAIVAEAARAGQRRGRLRSDAAGRSVSADRRQQLQQRERAVPDVLHRRAPGLPQAQRHRRQDQLRGSRSRRRARQWRSSSG